jgi:hypothetical protein
VVVGSREYLLLLSPQGCVGAWIWSLWGGACPSEPPRSKATVEWSVDVWRGAAKHQPAPRRPVGARENSRLCDGVLCGLVRVVGGWAKLIGLVGWEVV